MEFTNKAIYSFFIALGIIFEISSPVYDKSWSMTVCFLVSPATFWFLYQRHTPDMIDLPLNSKSTQIWIETFFWGTQIGWPFYYYNTGFVSVVGLSLYISGFLMTYISYTFYLAQTIDMNFQ